MKQHFAKIRDILTQVESDLIEELKEEKLGLEVEAKKVAKERRSVTTRAKNLKTKEEGFEKKSKEVEEGLRRIRKDEALTKFKDEVDQRLVSAKKREDDVTERESVVKATLEELEARQIKFNARKKDYKKKLEQEIVDRFLKK